MKNAFYISHVNYIYFDFLADNNILHIYLKIFIKILKEKLRVSEKGGEKEREREGGRGEGERERYIYIYVLQIKYN